MPLGNSITQGDMNHPTYRYELWKLMKRDGYAVDYVGTSRTNYNGDNPEQEFDQDHEGHFLRWEGVPLPVFPPRWPVLCSPNRHEHALKRCGGGNLQDFFRLLC